jgi:hypothetical protein
MDRARLPPCLRGSLALVGWPSGDGRYGCVSTALSEKVATAPFASSGAFGLVLHWPFLGPDVYVAEYPAPSNFTAPGPEVPAKAPVVLALPRTLKET